MSYGTWQANEWATLLEEKKSPKSAWEYLRIGCCRFAALLEFLKTHSSHLQRFVQCAAAQRLNLLL